MEQLRRHLRFIIPAVILLIIVAAICKQSHHHDCQGMIRVALVEPHDHHSPNDHGHHPHGCDGGCSVMIASAVMQSHHSVDAAAPTFQVDNSDLPLIALFHTHLVQSHKVEYLFPIPDEKSGSPFVTSLRGPPQC